MALRICPKCETNYLRPGDTLCSVCSAALKKKGNYEEEEETILCSNCGENPCVKGKDLCEECLKEMEREESLEEEADKVRAEEIEDPVVDLNQAL